MAEATWIVARWIVTRDGLQPEMVHRRWLSADGSRETDDNLFLSYMKILMLC